MTVNWNCYHYYQKKSKGPRGACVRRRGRLCHCTMASPSLLAGPQFVGRRARPLEWKRCWVPTNMLLSHVCHYAKFSNRVSVSRVPKMAGTLYPRPLAMGIVCMSLTCLTMTIAVILRWNYRCVMWRHSRSPIPTRINRLPMTSY